jgi:hypothetical protein
MSPDSSAAAPRHYFLSERHQRAPAEKDGGGGSTKVLNVDFRSHGAALSQGIDAIRTARLASPDPTTRSRVFIMAKPEASFERSSRAKDAKDDKKLKKINLSGADAQIIARLGFDLLSVTPDGAAVVHATDELLTQMQHSLNQLGSLSDREKAKWAHLKDLMDVPVEHKTSLDWWGDQARTSAWEATVDLQPCLTRSEVEQLIKVISSRLRQGERIQRSGVEFSGRTWFDTLLLPDTILALAEQFQSICSIHPPLLAITSARIPSDPTSLSPAAVESRVIAPFDARTLPCVAVLDTGIPTEHLFLGPYRRGGTSGDGASSTVQDGHGSFVSSRVIYGDVECDDRGEPVLTQGDCTVYDANVSIAPGSIRPDAIDSAIERVTLSAPDIRVFNLSIDAIAPLSSYQGTLREAWLRRIADLDNRAFADDLIMVVAAGNSVGRDIPVPPYPRHYEDARWELRAWSRCFNALTCGGTANRLVPNAVAKEPGAPSPFSRIGPGFAGSMKPDFSAHAGNCDAAYQQRPGDGMGVWGCDDFGNWADRSATSFAAPLLAREAARTLALLQARCPPGSRPFSALAKAVMALRATRSPLPKTHHKLADLTLGFGSVTLEDIEPAVDERAMFLWQGILSSDDEKLTVELPLPGTWLREAKSPILRTVLAWDTPVNPAVEDIWACRHVTMTLRPANGHGSLSSSDRNTKGYPLAERRYDLSDKNGSALIDGDFCLAELSYTNLGMAPYPAGLLEFSPQQRVAIAYELLDESETRTSPHAAIQSLPVSATLDRLSTVIPASRQAAVIRIPQ